MSMTAANAGLTAASAANNAMAQEAAHRARVDRCTVFESRFDVAKASVAEKQEYASCVETLYPQPTTETETYLLKGCILTLFVGLIVGAILGYRSERDLPGLGFGALAGVVFTAVGLMCIGLIIAGVGYLFS